MEHIKIAAIAGLLSTLPVSLPLFLLGSGVYWPFDIALSTSLFGIEAFFALFIMKGIIKVN